MSEAETKGAAILLPESKIHVISSDKETQACAKMLQDDWRFARVDIDVVQGGVENAIAMYAETQSPELVILQTDTIDDAFTDQLEILASHCAEGTAAIVIGPVNDVYLYRAMIEMGISDYLVRPVTSDVLSGVIVKTLVERIGVTNSRLIAISGAKGGVGASSIAQMSAYGVSSALDQKCILLDGSGGWSTLNVGLGFDSAATLQEAVRAAENGDDDGLARMIHKVSDKFDVLASGSDMMLESLVSPEQFEALIDMLMVKYPAVIVDLSQSPEALQRTVLARANQIQLISNASVASLRQGRSLLQEMSDVRGGEGDDIKLVINMAGLGGKNEVPASDIEAAMDMPVNAVIDFDPALFIGNESASALVGRDEKGAEIIRTALLPMLQDCLGGQIVEGKGAQSSGGFFANLIAKFTS